jgi:hypothetical protein
MCCHNEGSMIRRAADRPFRGASALLVRSAQLALIVALAACSSVSDQRIGRVLDDSPEAGGFDASVTDAPISDPGDVRASDARASDASACGQQSAPVVDEPELALYILLDRSSAMRGSALGNDPWNAVQPALQAYVAKASPSLIVGLAYFPAEDPTPCPCSGMPKNCSCRDRVLCTPEAYDPKVPVAPLSPEQSTRLTASLEGTEPNNVYGGMAPAMKQSDAYLQSWQKREPHKKAVRVIITASSPFDNSCLGDAGGGGDAIFAAKQSAFRTYVVAVGNVGGDPRGFGGEPPGLDQLADEGSARHPSIFDFGDRPFDGLAKILDDIVKWEKGCDYNVSGVDAATVQLELTLPRDDQPIPITMTNAKTRQGCDNIPFGFGWYKDKTLERVSLCDGTCKRMHEEGSIPSVVTHCPDSITH